MLRLFDNPNPRWPEDRPLAADLGNWWVARVKPRNEKAFAWDLARMGVGYYLPMMTRRTIRRDNGKPRKSVVCLFPGYVSLSGYEDRRQDILRTGRVLRVINVVDQQCFVQELDHVRRALEFEKELGLHPRLAVGQRVIIISGPMQGVQGMVIDINRPDKIYLNVEMFNRAVTVKVSPDKLELIEDHPAIKLAHA
jgi:transcriptional antiterminator RfaH